MRISGFSFVKNAVKLYYPLEESIRSILPICDEFVIAVGKSDDNTREIIENIRDPKIRIIDTDWDDVDTVRELILSNQTNVALNECTGDWCFYVQADEVVHEDDLPLIKACCEATLNDRRVEGLLFNYLHFWGDYNHYHKSHGWYPREIRIVRNKIGIRSVRDAQSFRREDGRKLAVASTGARIFHYGWVRPPDLMQVKRKSFNAVYIGRQKAEEQFRNAPEALDFGPLGRLPYFQSADHPEVMQKTIERLNWKDRLRDIDPPGMVREKHKDEKLKYRILTAIEAFTGLDFNHKNWRRIIRSRHPMKNPKVSLIIAVYKRADFLQRVLSSVENQTYRNFEVIVAEDDRAEGIRTLVDNRRESFPFPLIHVSQEDNGFRKNRILNEALRVSSGEYVVFIDGDCILHEKFIEEHVKNLGPDTCVFGRRAMLDERTTEMLLKKGWDYNLSFIRLLLTKTRRLEDALYIPWLKTFRKTGVKGSNFSVSRDLIFKINGFDEEFERPYGGEDTDIERRLRLVGADIRCTKFKTIQYHLHHGGREGRTEEWEKYGKPFYQKKVDAGEWFCKNGIVPLKGK